MKVKRIIIKHKIKERGISKNIDEDIIIKELEEQATKAQVLALNTIEPTIHTMKRMLKLVEEYIINNKLIVYGGAAVDAYLRVKDSELTRVEDPLKIKDYDFFTPNNDQDSIAIANILHDHGYQYSRRVKAIHYGTWRISAEFSSEFIADATFVPKDVFVKLPKTKIGNILFISPQYLKIDLYGSVNNPYKNYFRWEKSYKRLVEMERLYPISNTQIKQPSANAPISSVISKKIADYMKGNKNIIKIGTIAYNFYNAILKLGANLPIECYSFYAIDPIKEAEKLKKKLGSGFTINQYEIYLDIFDKHVELIYKKAAIAEWYAVGFDCISTINSGSISGFHWLLRFLYGKYCIEEINGNKIKRDYFAYMIQILQKSYNKYHEQLSIHRRDETNPFRILQLDCITADSEDEPELLEFKTNFYKKQEIVPIYKPEKNKIDPATVVMTYSGGLLGELLQPSA